MDSSDFIFKPHNTPRLRDKNIRDRHARLLAGGDYEGATALLKITQIQRRLLRLFLIHSRKKSSFLNLLLTGKSQFLQQKYRIQNRLLVL